MEKHSVLLENNLTASISAKQELLRNTAQLSEFERAADELVRRYRQGGRLYIAGNGGSAADAQHLAAEFVCRLGAERPSLAAEALTVDTSALTAIGNDYGFEQLFSRQLAGKASAKDIFLGITTSGKSPNIVRALEQCRSMNVPSIVFCGHDGGPARALADYCIIVPGKDTARIQELHIVLAHTLCECVERALFFC